MARRMLTLDGAPRTPQVEQQEEKKPKKSGPKVEAPRMGPVSRRNEVEQAIATLRESARVTAIANELRGGPRSQAIGRALRRPSPAIVIDTSNTVEERRARARIQQADRQVAERLGHLFNHLPRRKPTVSVFEALSYISRQNSGELLGVARDMVSRGQFVSEKQFSYAKNICLRPNNRAKLNAEYDLTALNAEEFVRRTEPTVDTRTFPVGTMARFECLVNSFSDQQEHAIHITHAFNLRSANGSLKSSVRSAYIPAGRYRISPNAKPGGKHSILVDAEWYLKMRGTDVRNIPRAELESS